MKVIGLTIENIKRISAVDLKVDPDSPAVFVRGPNGAGKSTVLDSMEYAFAGKASLPPDPIKVGERTARIVLETDTGLRVTRRFTRSEVGYSSDLVVEQGRGVLRSPQGMLDALCGKVGKGTALAFDPLRFIADKAAQAPLLRSLAGIDDSTLDAEIEALMGERKMCGAEGTILKGQVEEAQQAVGEEPVRPSWADDIDAAVEAAKADLGAVIQRNAEWQSASDAVTMSTSILQSAQTVRASTEQRVTEARKALRRAEKLHDQAIRSHIEAASELAKKQERLKRVPYIDAAPAQKALDDARMEQNVRAKNVRSHHYAHKKWSEDTARAEALQKKLDAARAKYKAQTEVIEKKRAEKLEMLAKAEWPVDGLGLDGTTVTFRGVPLEQASQAEQLRVACAIGIALQPELRVLLFRDASLLDTKSRLAIVDAARIAGAQVWLEIVADETDEMDDDSICISDGQVLRAP